MCSAELVNACNQHKAGYSSRRSLYTQNNVSYTPSGGYSK